MSKASVTHSLDANYKQKLSDFFFRVQIDIKTRRGNLKIKL